MKKIIGLVLMSTLLFTACSNSASTDDVATEVEQEVDTEETQGSETQEQLDAEQQAYAEKLLEKSDYMPQLEEVKKGDTIATISTSMGEIQVKLMPDVAPKTVENFVTLSEEGYYDGITFHRVIAGFMNQTGDPTATGTGGESAWGESFEDEFSPYAYQFTGSLAMANSGPNTNGSQFYINNAGTSAIADYFSYVDAVVEQYGEDSLLYDQSTGKMFRFNYSETVREKYQELGGNPNLDYGHTVFGQVISGMDVVDAINQVETGENDKPLEDVVINGIEISIAE